MSRFRRWFDSFPEWCIAHPKTVCLICGFIFIATIMLSEYRSLRDMETIEKSFQDQIDISYLTASHEDRDLAIFKNNVNPGQLHCLTEVIYYESGNQSVLGQRAVGHVVLNRVIFFNETLGKNYTNICDVVHDPKQFAVDKVKKPKYNEQAWNQAYTSAVALVYDYLTSDQFFDVTYGATHFHSGNLPASWKNKVERTVKIDDHIFYKLKYANR